MNSLEKSRIEQFKSAPVGTTGRAFLRDGQRKPFNLHRIARGSLAEWWGVPPEVVQL